MINVRASTLRPGYLVSLKTSVTGNANYKRVDIEPDHLTEEGTRKARWETERTVNDPQEHEAALKVRSKASSIIRSVCTWSAFGLLCPDDKSDKLDAAVAEARVMAEAFNANAALTKVGVYVLVGRISQTDAEAVKAINSEVREILAEMEVGIANMDVKRIRDNASRAKQLGNMLSPDMQARIQIAVDAVRSTARDIVKAGETAAKEVDSYALSKITEARTAFLDLDDVAPIQAPVVTARAIDLEPEDPELQARLDEEANALAESQRIAAEETERAIDLGYPVPELA